MSPKKKESKMDSQSRRQSNSGTDAHPAPVNYHGLMNQGATCYLNSVLQVLFMTKDFREALDRSMSGESDPEYIDPQLKDLFDDLKERQALTNKITKKLGIDRVCEQQDAAEYLEKILALTSKEASQIFHGELTNKTKCSTCQTEKSSDGKFWHLPLELVKSNSETYRVVHGIEEYFRELYFSGENQMYCDECDDKSDATTKCVLKDPPEVLTLLLKRFEFNYYYMSYIKNNCAVDVPCSLHIPESHLYELYAVVDHCGDLRSGHYTATVKPQDDDRWYNFNDTTVRLCDHEPYQADKSYGSCSAYLLFYRKKETPAADTSTQDTRDVSVSGGYLPAVGNNNDQCQDVGKKRKREEDEEEFEVEDGSDVDDEGVCAKKREIDEKKTIDDDEEGDTGAGEQAEKRGVFTETQPEESSEDQDSHHQGEDNVRLNKPQKGLEAKVTHMALYNEQRSKQEVGSVQVGQGYPQQVNVNMQRDEERKIMCVDIDTTGKSEGDEQTDEERKTLTKHPIRDEKDEGNEGVDTVKQKVREEDSSPYVRVNKKRSEEEMETNERDEKRGKMRTDRPTSGRGELLTRSDHCSHGFQIHNASKDDEGCKQRSSSSKSYKRHEPQEEEGKGCIDRKTGLDTSFRQVRSGGSGRLTENERVERAEDFQSKARAEDCTVGGVQERDRSSEDDMKRQVYTGGGNERKSGPRADEAVALPECFDNISLAPSPQVQRSRKTEHVEEKKKKKKTTGCSPFFCKVRGNAVKGSGDISQNKKKTTLSSSRFRKKEKDAEKGSDDVSQSKKKRNRFLSLFKRNKKNVVKASE